MADDRPTPIPPRPRLRSRPSLDNLEETRLADERDQWRLRAANAEAAAAKAIATSEAATKELEEANRRRRSDPPPKHQVDVVKIITAIFAGIALLLGGLAQLQKAPTEKVETQTKKIDTAIMPTQADYGERLTKLERFQWKQERWNVESSDHWSQVLLKAGIANVRRPETLSKQVSPIETKMSIPLPGQRKPPILIVETPYPLLEYASE